MTYLNQYKVLIIAGVLLFVSGILLVSSMYNPVGFDLYWHLQMGRDWLENGLSPWIDHYSFTFQGAEIAGPPFIFQALLHFFDSLLGFESGILAIQLLAYTLTLVLAVLLLRQLKAPTQVYVVVLALITFLLQLRLLVRPEIFSYAFSIAALMLYFRAGNKISTRAVLPMVLLTWTWTIYHTSILAYVIFFGFFLDCAVHQANNRYAFRKWLAWLAWGLVILFVGFLNPGFDHPLVQALNISPRWKYFVVEYLPLNSSIVNSAGFMALLLFLLPAPLLALKLRKLGVLFIWLLLMFTAILMSRMLVPGGIIVVLLTASLYIFRLQTDKPVARTPMAWVSGVLTLVLAAVVLWSVARDSRRIVANQQVGVSPYPSALVQHMKVRQMSGRIFNTYELGGYLLYQLAGQNQVYIDGRTGILYPIEHMQRYVAATLSSDALRAELEKYSIEHIILPFNRITFDAVRGAGGHGLDFVDGNTALFSRGRPNFPQHETLLTSPECWSPELGAVLDAERQIMREILPPVSALTTFSSFVSAYASAPDGLTYLDKIIEKGQSTDEMRRFTGFRYLESGQQDTAMRVFANTRRPLPVDEESFSLARSLAGTPTVFDAGAFCAGY